MVTERGAIDAIDVPRHIKEEFKVVAGHLHIMDIGNPQFTDIAVVSLAHLVVDESRLSCGEPQIIMRTSPIAEVVIDGSPTLTLLFTDTGIARHIAIVVIAPHQRYIVRHPESHLIQFQHLFIRYEHLHQFRGVSHIFPKKHLLVVNDLLKTVEFLLLRLITLHRTVVDTTHTDGEDGVGSRVLRVGG